MSDPPKKLDDIADLLKGIFVEGVTKQLEKSWCMVDGPERKARLAAVSKLCVELEKIKEQTIQATGLAEAVIEHIIEGDWEKAGRMIEMFTFERESEGHRSVYGPIYENFVVTGRTVCAEHARQPPGERHEPH
jgi:hypothetical protein